ncbi:NAD(P)/FAD-dependent oxidoreductase [Marinomonas ostreistagni]|uniref:NAD(P)-binding protein n=1 Tax=Marinomonas ostreistagni TaxID=359209 RepID=A0ABS0ZCY0_9GAMM|nr:NAD(P)-binding protein [Marinomonas ostreistagni]MBJ7550806.1 NAD(P)-binding protein [Marinomonas ostreistagni]
MNDIPHTRFAVIGAGLAGATFAYYANRHQQPCLVIDKSRGTGGRAGSKRLAHGSADLGASLISFSDEDLTDIREILLEQQVIERWQSAYVGVPRMSSITRYLTKDIELVTETKVHHIERRQGNWLLRNEKYQPICTAENLVIGAPAVQAAMLLATIPNSGALLQFANQAGSQTQPQWSMWVTTEKLDTAGLMPCDHPVLETLIKDSDKPDRNSEEVDTWVIQASPEWSKTHLDTPKSEVLSHLIQAFEGVTDTKVLDAGEPHRWLLGRQAMALSPKPFLWDDTLKICLIGDWLCQGDAEGAMLSAKYAFATIRNTYQFNEV